MIIHRCAECRHQAIDHGYTAEKTRRGPCSIGGCPCALTPEQVRAANDPVDVPTWPALDHRGWLR